MDRRSLDISTSFPTYNRTRASTSSVPSTPVMPIRPPSLEKKALHPGDSGTFLTALASQERLVFELKETLQKAEIDLEKLKKQWALHEATRKRNEIRQLEKLRPLNASIDVPKAVENNEKARSSREQERRKVAPVSTRPSQRKVFSGSRHIRTLSLLSPKPKVAPQNGPSTRSVPLQLNDDKCEFSYKSDILSENVVASHSLFNGPNTLPGSSIKDPKDAIIETGKQLVGDFHTGLWTFFEDIRQATIGEEAINGSNTRKLLAGASNTRRQVKTKKADASERNLSSRQLVKDDVPATMRHVTSANDSASLNKSCFSGTTIEASQPAPGIDRIVHMQPTVINDSDDDEWDAWESPAANTPPSLRCTTIFTSDPMASPLTEKSSPRTSIGYSLTTSFIGSG